MRKLSLYTAKGGQGCSTVAAMLALQAGDAILVDAAPVPDLCAVLGVTAPIDWAATPGVAVKVVDRVRLVRGRLPFLDLWGWDAPVAVWDYGLRDDRPGSGRSLLVTRNDYLSLRRAMAHRHRPDGVILVEEPGRPLGRDDVEAVIGVPVVATIPIDPAIARTLDAGLITTRQPKSVPDLGYMIHQEA